ncbi:MAG: pyridoxal 5'-phosphate synthase glutaminase subunit PdxT [Acidimicrobiales bacterium]
MRIGVLALQGASQEHLLCLSRLGIQGISVKAPQHLEGVDALIIPGGESTTISMLLESSGVAEPLAERLARGMPAFGTCAGMILLAHEVIDGRADQLRFDAVDISVRRNGFGRQVASFEADLSSHSLGGEPIEAVFIRAPLVERVGDEVEVLASVEMADGHPAPAMCRQGNVLVTAFHPELSRDDRVHRLFLEMVEHSLASTQKGA